MVYRNQKHVVIGLGSLAVGSLAALVAASCAQNDRGEPASMLRASATVTGATPTFTAPPTFTIIRSPCDTKDCSEWRESPKDDLCTYHCQVQKGVAVCGVYESVCDDLNQCTTDSCVRSTGACSFTNNTIACNDGDPCTTNDTCGAGACTGSALGCDDNNVCTSDSCENGECLHAAVDQGVECNDQNGCTNGDACNSNGVCVGSGGPDCDDDNPCTKNSCANSECSNDQLEPVGTPCLNANKCLVNAACDAQGACTSAEEKSCDDNNPCTVDSCDPEVGCVSEPDDTASCTDGDICTLNDACVDGVCVPETGITCQPIDDCHAAGQCDPVNGLCSDPRKPDGETCENTGMCEAGRCVGGTPDPVGEGGAGGETSTGDGGAVATGGTPANDAGNDAGGRIGGGGRPGTSGSGGRGVVAPGPDAGDDGTPPANEQEFKRDPGGCAIGAAREPAGQGLAGLLVLLGAGLFGLRRRSGSR